MRKILYFIIPIVIVIMVWMTSGTDDQYIESMKGHRAEKEQFFRESEASPFVQKNSEYKPASYFDIDPAYRVTAKLRRLPKRETLTISNSDGSSTKYLKFATAHFNLKKQDYSLVILKALGFGNQFLTAFADETSGDSTYGGGRYLDLVIGKSDRIEIDFNKAYNPYCAYFEDFLCPFPPKENILEVAIEAGEKDYK